MNNQNFYAQNQFLLDPLDNQNDFLMDDEINENNLNFPRGMGFELDGRSRTQQQQSNQERIVSRGDELEDYSRFRYQNPTFQSGGTDMPIQHANFPQNTDFGQLGMGMPGAINNPVQ